jgi:hypothetical protein
MVCDRRLMESVMRKIAVLSAALITVCLGAPASAQNGASVKERMTIMRTQNPGTFESCQALAVQRGYNLNDEEGDGAALMHFISGCIMGQRR